MVHTGYAKTGERAEENRVLPFWSKDDSDAHKITIKKERRRKSLLSCMNYTKKKMGIGSNQPDFALYTESSHLQQQFPIITKNKRNNPYTEKPGFWTNN